MVNRPPTVIHSLVKLKRQAGRQMSWLRYTSRMGHGMTVYREGRQVKKAIAQETLATLVKTGAAREFRVLREGEAWRLELRLGAIWLAGALKS